MDTAQSHCQFTVNSNWKPCQNWFLNGYQDIVLPGSFFEQLSEVFSPCPSGLSVVEYRGFYIIGRH